MKPHVECATLSFESLAKGLNFHSEQREIVLPVLQKQCQVCFFSFQVL